MAKSTYFCERLLRWVMGEPFPAPALALYLGLHTSHPDTVGVGEADVFGRKKRHKIEQVGLQILTSGQRLRLTNTHTLELGEVKRETRGVVYLGIWDREDIGTGSLLFYSQLPQTRDLLVGDRVVLPAQAFVMEEE